MLSNKVIIITGGAGLLGLEFVKMVLKNNGIAIIGDLDDRKVKNFKQNLSKNYNCNNLDFYYLDITDKNSIVAMIDYVSCKYNKIDAIVNNAYPKNKNYGKKFFDVEYLDFCENISIHLGGYFLVSQQISKYFINQGYGNIINISSIYGVIAPKFEIYDYTDMTVPVEYAAIKSAIIHLTKYMSKYLKGKNIRINTISLGGILDKQPKTFTNAYNNFCLNKGMLNADDIQGTLLFLLSDLSKYVNGQNLIVDDGFTL